MAGTIKHRYTNPIAQQAGYGPPNGGVGPNEWNDSLVVAAGNNLDVMERDSGQADGWKLALPYYHGQCRLVKDGANLRLNPYNGNRLIINGRSYAIPASGVALGTGGLGASTTYYIYVYDNAGTLTLEASATAYATDTTTGVTIKNGDATRTLVGLARTTAGTAWADSAAQRFVVSWFNRGVRKGFNRYTALRSTTSATFVEVDTEIRVEFVKFADDPVVLNLHGRAVATGGQAWTVAPSFDGSATNAPTMMNTATLQTVAIPRHSDSVYDPLAEGYHYATLLGAIAGGATLQLEGSAMGTVAVGPPMVLYVSVG